MAATNTDNQLLNALATRGVSPKGRARFFLE